MLAAVFVSCSGYKHVRVSPFTHSDEIPRESLSDDWDENVEIKIDVEEAEPSSIV